MGARRHSNAVLVSYGVHRMFTDAGNVVACRFCVHFNAVPSPTPGRDYCAHHEELVDPNSRCFANFERAVGSDDEAFEKAG